MEHFAGIDVSLEQSSVCVVDGTGSIVCETKVTSEPEALVRFFRGLEIGVTRIGLEAGLVDVKVCAVNEIWSGLKFVIRLKDRSKADSAAPARDFRAG